MAKDVNRVVQWLKEVKRASSWPFQIHPRLQPRPRHFSKSQKKRKNSQEKKIPKNITEKNRKFRKLSKIEVPRKTPKIQGNDEN